MVFNFIYLKLNQFCSKNCFRESLEQPDSPFQMLINTSKHTDSRCELPSEKQRESLSVPEFPTWRPLAAISEMFVVKLGSQTPCLKSVHGFISAGTGQGAALISQGTGDYVHWECPPTPQLQIQDNLNFILNTEFIT